MKTGSFKGAFLSALIIVSIVALAIPLLSSGPVHAAMTSHDPIYINGNDNFTLANGVTSGSGAENDPYIIENWNIDASNAQGIRIENTDVHFLIRNCNVHGKSNYWGVILQHVMNGTIDGVTSESNYSGFAIDDSLYVAVTNCISTNNLDTGIEAGYSPGTIIENCNVRNNTRGIVVSTASNKIRYCSIENNEFGITLTGTDTNIVVGCAIENNYWAINVNYSLFADIENCNIKNNRGVGIQTYFSLNSTIKNCLIEKSPTGAYFSYSLRNFVENCTIKNCGTGIGFGNESFVNNITNCTFRNNTTNIYPKPATAKWPLIIGIIVVATVIGISTTLYMKTRRARKVRKGVRSKRRKRSRK